MTLCHEHAIVPGHIEAKCRVREWSYACPLGCLVVQALPHACHVWPHMECGRGDAHTAARRDLVQSAPQFHTSGGARTPRGTGWRA